MAPKLHHENRGPPSGSRGTYHRADQRVGPPDTKRFWPLRRLRGVFALRQEGSEGASVSHVPSFSEWWLDPERSSRSCQLRSMAGFVESLQNSTPDVRHRDDGYVGVVRSAHRATGETLRRSLSSCGGCRRLGKGRQTG